MAFFKGVKIGSEKKNTLTSKKRGSGKAEKK